MKKALPEIDPLGERPAPVTGDAAPRYLDEELRVRSEEALSICQGIWVKHERQDIIIAQLRAYLGAWSKTVDKSSCGGRRLSQYSQAGKSATMRRLRKLLGHLGRERGLAPNKFQVVIITLKKRLSLKGLYRLILKQLGDPHYDQAKVSTETLLRRIEELSVRLGVELLVIDEVQHLDNQTRDAIEVLDQLKTFIDEALFPIVFVGDEDSLPFFERNCKLAARLGDPLELRPLRPLSDDADAAAFQTLCARFDRALVKRLAIEKLAGLDGTPLLDGLMLASSGHVGRVARILQIAVPFSIWRGAETVEAYDLSYAIRSYAIKNRWIDSDPFSIKRS
jgi:hypothetical protein